jgi:hypothetical protein
MEKINIKLAKEKGLINDNNYDLYQKVYLEYKYVLEYYLNELIDFKKYEDEINNSGLYIGVNSKYQSLNQYLKTDYIFLINSLFVEKLDKKDIDLLLNDFNKDNLSINVIEMVRRTFKDIIYDNYLNGEYVNKIYKVCYGPMVPFNFVDNDSLVFKIYYGKNTKEILDTKEFIKLDKKQINLFNHVIDNLKKEVYDKLGLKCEILIEKDINLNRGHYE